MERFACKILFLILVLLSCAVQAQDKSGMRATVKDYILPQYRGSDGRLQFLVFGDEATNKGAQIYLDHAKIDILHSWAGAIAAANIYIPSKGDKIPQPYALDASQETIEWFWSHPKQRSVRAWIFSDKAVFDKTMRILRSDDKAYFRSRELDADGIGFDADHERKFIHIRSHVKVYLRPKIRRGVTGGVR